MELYFKTTVGFLLFAQCFHLALLQNSTDSVGRTIAQEWLRRGLVKNPSESQNTDGGYFVSEAEVTEEPNTVSNDATNEGTAGSMSLFSGEGELAQDIEARETSDGETKGTVSADPVFPSGTTESTILQDATISSDSTTTDSTLSDQNNGTEAGENSTSPQTSTTPQNSTTQATSTQNTTISIDNMDIPDTEQPESNSTTESTPEPDNSTESATSATTTVVPKIVETITSSPTTSTTETTEMSPETTTMTTEIGTMATTTVDSDAPEEVNVTDKGATSGSSSERGVASDLQMSRRKEAWGAVLGTAVALACVALVAYIILKKKKQKDFSHRKLVEDFRAEPVLRLDNSEPLDLNYGGGAYYNPGVQGDNIQMSNFPGNFRK